MAKANTNTPATSTPAAAPTLTPAQQVQATHLALAQQLAAVLGLPGVRVPSSLRWLVATAVWHTKGGPGASALVAQWAAAYGVPVPPLAQYRVMHDWLSRGVERQAATGVSKPPRQPKATPAPVQA